MYFLWTLGFFSLQPYSQVLTICKHSNTWLAGKERGKTRNFAKVCSTPKKKSSKNPHKNVEANYFINTIGDSLKKWKNLEWWVWYWFAKLSYATKKKIYIALFFKIPLTFLLFHEINFFKSWPKVYYYSASKKKTGK